MGALIISPSTVLGFILLGLALRWVWRALNWVWLRPKRLERRLLQQGLKGNSYHSLYGDLGESSKMLRAAMSRPIGLSDNIVLRLLPFLDKSIRTYGQDSFIWYGPAPRVNVMDPEQIKDVLNRTNDFHIMSSNPRMRLLVKGLAMLKGAEWEMHRKIMNPAFRLEKLKLMSPAFYSCCNEMVIRWEDLMSAEESIELDVWTDLENLSADVISRTAFGSSYEEGRLVFQLQKEQTMLGIKSLRTVYIPGWSWFFPIKLTRRMKSIHKQVESLLREIINKRERSISEGEAANDDLLGLLIESNKKEISRGLSTQDVIEECKLFYFAGQETTSVLLVWTMVLLSIHPQWQARARDEVLKVFGREKPNFDGLNRLKIVTMILYEVLRLYPPVMAITRIVRNETKLGKLTLPAGVQLALLTVLVHRDKELWGDDAEEFNPERFSEGISKATKNRTSFFPFGWGPRICIGQNFALVEAKMAMSMILQCFYFELSPSYAHAPMSLITLQPQYGAQIILRRA